MTDTLTNYKWVYTIINGSQHVSRVYHFQSTGQQFNDALFTYETRTDIVSPFLVPLTGQPVTAVLLKEVSFTGAVGPFKFDYNTSAEVTKVTVPYKGYFRYDYATASFSSGGRETREISARYMSADGSAGSEQAYTFSHPSGDTSLPQHTETTLVDAASNKKVWYFIQGSSNGWDNGLVDKHEVWQGPGPGFTLLRTIDSDWTQDNPGSQSLTNPRVASVTTTLEDGTTQSKGEQDVDANGNVVEVREYAFGNLTTPQRTTSATYLGGTNYTSRNILNRPTQITVCDGAAGCGSPASSTTITYDSVFPVNVSGITQHDPAYPWTFTLRGNPRQVDANGLVTTQTYDIGGNLLSTKDALNHTVASTNFSATTGQPSDAASGGSTTSFNWNADTTLNNSTGSNSNTVSFVYSSTAPHASTTPTVPTPTTATAIRPTRSPGPQPATWAASPQPRLTALAGLSKLPAWRTQATGFTPRPNTRPVPAARRARR